MQHMILTYDIWLTYDICMGNRLHVCFIYIKFFTYVFMAINNFVPVVCAKGGFYTPWYNLGHMFFHIWHMIDIWHMYGN